METARPGAPRQAAKRRKRKAVRPLTAAQRKALLSHLPQDAPGSGRGEARQEAGAKTAGREEAGREAQEPAKAHKKKPVKRASPPKKKKKRTAKRIAARTAAKTEEGEAKHAMGTTGWAELLLLALLPFGAVGGLLLGTDYAPPATRAARSRRRRSAGARW